MLNTYNKYNHTHEHNIKINSCSGGIYKTYKESWFKIVDLDSELMDILSNHETCTYNPKENRYSKYNYNCGEKPIVVLQMVICGEMKVIAEIMYKEDFDKYCEIGDNVTKNVE